MRGSYDHSDVDSDSGFGSGSYDFGRRIGLIYLGQNYGSLGFG